jgi:hypothetical protein
MKISFKCHAFLKKKPRMHKIKARGNRRIAIMASPPLGFTNKNKNYENNQGPDMINSFNTFSAIHEMLFVHLHFFEKLLPYSKSKAAFIP